MYPSGRGWSCPHHGTTRVHVCTSSPFKYWRTAISYPGPDLFSDSISLGLQRPVGTSRTKRGRNCYSAIRHPRGGSFPKGVRKRMKPFFLSSLSTPPAPQEAGIWALTSHLADISHLESCGGVSWDLGPPTHLPACHLPPPQLSKGDAWSCCWQEAVRWWKCPLFCRERGEDSLGGGGGRKEINSPRQGVGRALKGPGGEHAEPAAQGPWFHL